MFKKLFSNLVNDLVQKLPKAAKFGNKSVEDYYYMFNFYPKKLTLTNKPDISQIF